MAILRGCKQSVAAQTVSAASVTTGAITTTTGSLLVAVIACFGNHIGATPVSDSKGNTWVQAIGSTGTTNGFGAIFYCANATGGASHTFTFTPTAADFNAITVHEIPGALTSGVLGNTSTGVANSTAHPTGNITSTTEEIWVGGCTVSGAGPPLVTVVQPRTFFETSSATGASTEGLITAIRMVENGITDQMAFTTVTSRNEAAMLAGFKLATIGGSGTLAATFIGG